jgi:hypothetical protein
LTPESANARAVPDSSSGGPKNRSPRWRRVMRKWTLTLWTALICASLVLLGAPWVATHIAPTVTKLSVWMWFPLGILIAGTFGFLTWVGAFGVPGLAKAYANPPRWMLILMTLALIFGAWDVFPETIPTEIVAILVATHSARVLELLWLGLLGLAVLLVAGRQIVRCIRVHQRGPVVSSRPAIDPSELDFAGLLAWLRTDEKINTPEQDAFRHQGIARRIAGLIAETARGNLGRCPTFALVGEVGAGKSSILNLVRYALEEQHLLDEHIVVASVSLWPFDSTPAAIRGILGAIEREFAKLTSTTSITRVPGRYLKAVEKLDHRLGAVSELLTDENDPVEVLRAYDRLAVLVNVQVVAWIEDLERFEGTGDDAAARTAPIRALLYQLQQSEKLTVVLASDSLHSRIDLQKLARFVERVPDLNAVVTWPLIARFRSGCREMFKGDIDPASDHARKILSETYFETGFGPIMPLQRAVVYLCRTPRTLKSALRTAGEVWQRLHGEADFDDVFLMSVIRTACPDVFALVDEYVSDLRSPVRRRTHVVEPVDDSVFEVSVNKIAGKGGLTRMAIDAILGFVFYDRPAGRSVFEHSEKPQGFGGVGHRDYWPLFLGTADLLPSESDQPVLRAIADWNAGATASLVSMVADDARSGAVEAFSEKLDPKSLPRLLKEVVGARIDEPPETWSLPGSRRDDPPGMIVVWRLCQEKFEQGKLDQVALAQALKDVLVVSIARNLRLAQALSDWFFFEVELSPVLIPLDEVSRLISVLEAQLLGLVGSSGGLVAALRGTKEETLFRVCWRRDRVKAEAFRSGMPFGRWPAFSATVILAAKEDPLVMIPQVLRFFVSYSVSALADDEGVSEFPLCNREVAERLFDISTLRPLLRDLDVTRFPDRVAAQIRCAREGLGSV